MRSNDEAIANNTANYTPDTEAPSTEEALREHSLAMDEQAITDAVERMLRNGARAQVMSLFDELIREHRLDRFIGRIAMELP